MTEILVPSEMIALEFYVEMRMPNMQGVHEFKIDPNASVKDIPVTWINGTDFTSAEVKMLDQGEAVMEEMENILNKIGLQIQEQDDDS